MSVALDTSFQGLAEELAEVSRLFYSRGWAFGTSGNFSAVVRTDPLTLAITTSGVDKGLLESRDVVAIDTSGRVVQGTGRASAEAALHLAIVRARGAGAVLHTHSIWSTILSDGARAPSLTLDGYEMLKGLDGVRTHEHEESLPIIDNSQDWAGQVPQVEAMLGRHSAAHGFLIRRHGLYTWGRDLAEAKRHVEILEFLFEATGRSRKRG